MNTQDLSKAISIVQLSQMAMTLVTAIHNAVSAGKDSVTEEEIAASFAEKDAALVQLADAIVRAMAEGR